MEITFNDIEGKELNINDWCKVAHSRNNSHGGNKLLTFYVPMKIIEDGRLQPFDNFCFDQIYKIKFEDIPTNAVKSDKDYYVVYQGDEADSEEKRQSYILSKLRFDLNRKFYSISA